MKSILKPIMVYACLLISGIAFAQDKTAEMRIDFEKEEGKHVCKVTVTSEDKPVAEVAVKLYVKRLFGNLEIGEEATTDEAGVAGFEFPDDIPLNEDGKLIVLAKVEDDENYGSFESETQTSIGKAKDLSSLLDKSERSISGANAPIYFIVGSLVVFAGIWAAILYVILLVFKIKKNATQIN